MRISSRRALSNSPVNPFRQILIQPSSSREISSSPSFSSSSLSKWPIIPILLLCIPSIILYSIFLDTNVGGKLYFLRSITQTELDTQLKEILPKTIMAHGGVKVKIPPPSALISPNTTAVVLKPTMGKHRPDQDAIFAIADGMNLRQLALFVITLRNTGFEGDVVFSTWSRQYMSQDVIDFLEYHSKNGLVVYEGVVIADNQNQTIQVNDDYEVEHTNVWLRGLYGKDYDEENNEVYHDPRPARSLGIARFELFWAWSLQYKTQSRILLIDAKDTYFQPFGEIGIGVGRTCEESAPSILHVYEENNHAVKLGSIENRAHLVEAYKDKRIMRFLHNSNVLSPASTHGPKISIEAYLRAMTQQFDETGCATYQCEWAFHNYLYSFGVLAGMDEIDNIKTHMQGTGAVNSIGHNIPLNSTNHTEIFDNETVAVLNRRMGHGKHNSWAVHQYTSDNQLMLAVNDLSNYLLSDVLNYSQPMQLSVFFFYEYDVKADDLMRSKPTMGKHRPKEDAIFSFVEGNFDDLALFILSARKSGFEGDIVVNTPSRADLSEYVIKFLEYHSNHGVVVYVGYDIEFDEGFYNFKLDQDNVAFETAKYEYFYVWSHHYKNNQIMILDGEYSFFQSNPFATPIDCGELTLNFYEENKLSMNFQFMKTENKDIWSAMMHVFDPPNEKVFYRKFKDEFVLNPTVIYGHQHVLQKYLLTLITMFDTTGCVYYGCDYAAVNYIWYEEILEIGSPISVVHRSHPQGSHVVNTGIAASIQFLAKRNLFDSEKKLYLNWKGEPSPVILNYHLNTQLQSHFSEMLQELLEDNPYYE